MTGTLTPDERLDRGRAAAKKVPHDLHGDWSTRVGRPDPVSLIEEQNVNRIQWLVPVRRSRMSISPFTFYRGSARIMAADLAHTPDSGIRTQICGDAHLANFGAYASPERRLVFDLNDFDETLAGPWEWDIKRLATSFVLAGRHNGLSPKETRKITRLTLSTYRKAMEKLATMPLTDIWYSLVEIDRVSKLLRDPKMKRDARKYSAKARTKDSRHALRKLTLQVDGEYRIRTEPPLLIPVRDIPDKKIRDQISELLPSSFTEYQENVSHDVRTLLKRYRLVDFAVKVVGVGSVGTGCYVLLLEGRDHHDPLFLQIKQAGRSVLEEFLPSSPYRNTGRRVIEGQRLMQTVSDIFLGWTRSKLSGNDYYWRQLKDWKASADVDHAPPEHLHEFARLRGWTLARAHARTGDPIAISAYLGPGKTFDRAVLAFAEKYADQAVEDHAAFVAEIRNGNLEATELGT